VTHPNEEVIRSYVTAFASGDLEVAQRYLSDGIVYHVSGHHSLSGDYAGKDAVVAFFKNRSERTGGTFKVTPHDLLANDNHGVALSSVSAKRGQRDFAWNVVTVYHVAQGQVTECWIFDGDADTANEALA